MISFVFMYVSVLFKYLFNLKEFNKKLIEILLIVKKNYYWNIYIIYILVEKMCVLVIG